MELILMGSWVVFTAIGCCIVKFRNADRLRVMSCRSLLKRYKKLDEADNKSLF